MKKNVSLLFCVLFEICFSQKGLVNYGFIDAMTIGNGKGPDSNSYLIFNKEQSYYVTAKDSLEQVDKINEQKVYSNDDDSGGTIYNGMKVSKEGDQVVYNIKKDTIWSNLLYRKQIYIKEVSPKINWNISKETKQIGNHHCQKATTFFRGRDYTAWFTTDIPVPFGPWKLQGLPGLILEAYDKNKEVYWYFKSIDYPSNIKDEVKFKIIPTKEVFLTYEEFKALQKKEQDIVIEKSMILKKQFPQIEVEKPKLSIMFIECE